MISNPEYLLLLLAGLFAAAALLIGVYPLLKQSRTQSIRELWRIYAYEFLIVAAVLLPAYLGTFWLLLALLLFSLRAHWEILESSGTGFSLIYPASFLFSSILFIIFVLHALEPYVVQGLLFAATSVSGLLIYLTGKKIQLQNWMLFIVVLSSSFLLTIAGMEQGFLHVLFLYIITETNDSFAWLTGKLVGRKKLFPSISPQKTLEGLVGGIMVSLPVGLLFNYYFLEMPWMFASTLVCLIIASAVTGDLLFSVYKRRLGVKDFPAVIRDQGGVLDIYDSLLAASIVYYPLVLIYY